MRRKRINQQSTASHSGGDAISATGPDRKLRRLRNVRSVLDGCKLCSAADSVGFVISLPGQRAVGASPTMVTLFRTILKLEEEAAEKQCLLNLRSSQIRAYTLSASDLPETLLQFERVGEPGIIYSIEGPSQISTCAVPVAEIFGATADRLVLFRKTRQSGVCFEARTRGRTIAISSPIAALIETTRDLEIQSNEERARAAAKHRELVGLLGLAKPVKNKASRLATNAKANVPIEVKQNGTLKKRVFHSKVSAAKGRAAAMPAFKYRAAESNAPSVKFEDSVVGKAWRECRPDQFDQTANETDEGSERVRLPKQNYRDDT
jgi:hypothetical protein